ncbi:MAG: putative sugar O-methyltransferase [Armatimonadota bacterium]|nr:putative sugar O-methyltransferase [Armatimonadota bacterium]
MRVRDDPELLELMMADMQEADALYRPTNYWAVYQRSILPEVRALGLHDFRRRELSALAATGATDPWLPGGVAFTRRVRNMCWAVRNRTGLRVTWPITLARAIDGILTRLLPLDLPWGLSPRQLQQLAAENCRIRADEAGAKPLSEFEASLAGNPDGVFEIDGRPYTMKMLHYYLRYVACCRHVDLDEVRVYVELGCGAGRQIEVIRKLHPSMVFLAFDIPPQLYVAQQFLQAVFGDDVVPYRQTREVQSLEDLRELAAGRIFILPTWKFPLLRDLDIDLFWNAASFQEMEPHVVANYLGVVNQQAYHVFLHQQFSGKPRASAPGELGVMEPVTLEDYREGLSNFELVDMRPSWGPLGVVREQDVYQDSVWRRVRSSRP